MAKRQRKDSTSSESEIHSDGLYIRDRKSRFIRIGRRSKGPFKRARNLIPSDESSSQEEPPSLLRLPKRKPVQANDSEAEWMGIAPSSSESEEKAEDARAGPVDSSAIEAGAFEGPLQGIVSDAAHKFWKPKDAILIVSSTYCAATNSWMPVLESYSQGQSRDHYATHFFVLFEGILLADH